MRTPLCRLAMALLDEYETDVPSSYLCNATRASTSFAKGSKLTA